MNKLTVAYFEKLRRIFFLFLPYRHMDIRIMSQMQGTFQGAIRKHRFDYKASIIECADFFCVNHSRFLF